MSKLPKDAAELFVEGRHKALRAGASSEDDDGLMDRMQRIWEFRQRLESISVAEVLVDLNDLRKEAADNGKFKEAVAASKLLLEHLPKDNEAIEARNTGSRTLPSRDSAIAQFEQLAQEHGADE